MRVVILRHSTAVDPYGAPTDESRWLTADGRTRARAVARVLAQELTPTHIYASPLVRAMQTADLIAEGLSFGGAVVTHPPLAAEYGTTAQALSVLDNVGDRSTILLVSHAPKVRVLTAHLAGLSTLSSFRTCSACAVDMTATGAGQIAFWIDPNGPARLNSPPNE